MAGDVGFVANPGNTRETAPGDRPVGKPAAARRSDGPRTRLLNCVCMVKAAHSESPLWVMVDLKIGKVPVLIDTGANFLVSGENS